MRGRSWDLEAVLASGEQEVATTRSPAALSELLKHINLKQEQIKTTVKATKEHFRRLDMVVKNARYGIQGSVEGTPELGGFWKAAVLVAFQRLPLPP